MKNKTYDILKFIALIFLPALGTLYFALSQIWGLPYGEQIVGTITAIDTFLGALLGISTMQYNKGKEEKWMEEIQTKFDVDNDFLKALEESDNAIVNEVTIKEE